MSAKRERFLVWLHGEGIEIGALHNPLPIPPWVNVRYVDRVPEAVLREHYPEITQPFVPVSILASAEDLSPIPDSSLDFVIANHLLEHLEDPVQGLKEFHRVLRPDGVVYLALPDQRQSFDRDRQLTTVEHLLDEHRHGAEVNRRAHYEDWAVNVDKQPAERKDWVDYQMQIGYSIHFHVWRPETFLEFYLAVKWELGLDFELVALAAPEEESDNEFIAILVKGAGDRVHVPRGRQEPAPAGASLRQRVAAGPLGPVLVPSWHGLRRLVRTARHRS